MFKRYRPFGNVTKNRDPYYEPNPGGSDTRSRFSVGGNGVELGRNNSTPVSGLCHSAKVTERFSSQSELSLLDLE